MADWIKAEKSTPRKPEVLRIATELEISPDHAFGMCFRFWSWCDDNLESGNALGVTGVMLDALLGFDGFAQSLVNVGWLRVRNGSLEVPNYDRHLSENAKKRCLSQQRTAKSRSRLCNDSSVTKALPEKKEKEKREDKKILKPSEEEGALKFVCKSGDVVEIKDGDLSIWKQSFPGLDVASELRMAWAKIKTADSHIVGSTAIRKYFNNWLGRASSAKPSRTKTKAEMFG